MKAVPVLVRSLSMLTVCQMNPLCARSRPAVGTHEPHDQHQNMDDHCPEHVPPLFQSLTPAPQPLPAFVSRPRIGLETYENTNHHVGQSPAPLTYRKNRLASRS